MPLLDNMLQVTLGSFRMGGLLVSMPVFGTTPLPFPLKFFLAFGFSFMTVSFRPPLPQALWQDSGTLFLVVVREVGLGLFMGYCMKLIFLVVTLGLELAGLQMGFGIASVFDPQNNAQLSILAHLGVVLTILFFFATNMHHDVFYTVVRSYEKIPIGLPDWDLGTMIMRLLAFVKSSFEMSLRLAFPVLVAMLVIHVVMGLITRAAPQMNLFFNMAFIVNIVTGLILVAMGWQRVFSQAHRFERFLTTTGYGLW